MPSMRSIGGDIFVKYTRRLFNALMRRSGRNSAEQCLYDAARIYVDAVKQEADRAIYSTPPADRYTRTQYLRESVYRTTKNLTDYETVSAYAATLPGNLNPGIPRDNYRMRGRYYVSRPAEVRVIAGAQYAPYVEYGTWKMPARPFVRPVIDSAEVANRVQSDVTRRLILALPRIGAFQPRDNLGRFLSWRIYVP